MTFFQSTLIVTLTTLIFSCSSVKPHENEESEASLSLLTEEQSKELNDIILNNSFLSGCVTEELSDLKEKLCAESRYYCQANFDSKLRYEQWLSVYQSCVVAPDL